MRAISIASPRNRPRLRLLAYHAERGAREARIEPALRDFLATHRDIKATRLGLGQRLARGPIESRLRSEDHDVVHCLASLVL